MHGKVLLGATPTNWLICSPLIVGGWRNKALDENLVFSECEEDDDPTRTGVWTTHGKRLKIGREKFVALSVPKDFVASTEYDC